MKRKSLLCFILRSLFSRNFHCSVSLQPPTRTEPSKLRACHMCISTWKWLEKALDSWLKPSCSSLLSIGTNDRDTWASIRDSYSRNCSDGGGPHCWGTLFSSDKCFWQNGQPAFRSLFCPCEFLWTHIWFHFFVDLRDKPKMNIAVFCYASSWQVSV